MPLLVFSANLYNSYMKHQNCHHCHKLFHFSVAPFSNKCLHQAPEVAATTGKTGSSKFDSEQCDPYFVDTCSQPEPCWTAKRLGLPSHFIMSVSFFLMSSFDHFCTCPWAWLLATTQRILMIQGLKEKNSGHAWCEMVLALVSQIMAGIENKWKISDLIIARLPLPLPLPPVW